MSRATPGGADPEGHVRHAARLARLELTEEEVRRLAPQFERILAAFGELQELDPGDATEEPPTTPTRLRVDAPAEPPFDSERLLAQAPEPIGRFFGVPKTVSRDP